VAVGRVVRFDAGRGYGFIAPEQGGEDVFLHVNDLLIPELYLRSGLAVEFEVATGDRGLKATGVRFAPGTEAAALAHPPEPARVAQAPWSAARAADQPGEEPMCDVLGVDEFRRDVTELLLASASQLTGEQVLALRAALLRFAQGHGWVED
jgi:CspA family cold shock protein